MSTNYGYQDDRLDLEGEGKKGRKLSSTSFHLRLSNSNYLTATTSKNPQAMFKISSHVRGARVKNLLEYIGRTDRGEGIELEDESGVMLTGKNDIQELYQDWSQDFERAKPNAKRAPRHVSHFILSADAENNTKNLMKVQEAARKTCKELYGDKGYRYVIGMHQDGNKPHVHVAISSYNVDKKKGKLRVGPAEIHEVRTRFAKELSELGLKHEATLRKDRPKDIGDIIGLKAPLKSKTDNSFTHELNKKPSAKYLKALSASIVKLRNAVNESYLEGKDRTYLRHTLRRLEKNLIENPGEVNQHIGNTVKAFTQYRHIFSNELKGIVNPVEQGRAAPDREKLSNLIDFKAHRDIRTARVEIERIEDPRKKEESLKALNDYSVKLIGKGLDELKQQRNSSSIINDLNKNIEAVYDRIASIDKLQKEKLTAPEILSTKREKENLMKGLFVLIDKRKKELDGLSDYDKGKKKALKQMQRIQQQVAKERQRVSGYTR